ncbi:hypothetical protein BTR14_16040 [Rhizobium rhizosphaerae]|uniref:Uncharacterized protein n=2 Tax=Xaviernesmea rhizosphaerae TaxID=1672749 RepID=A0ABX3PBJ3_9HYPH|nr:hypothetical protein BTR14_16040 [Xaviernesmea rhizosphaerae]
MRSNSMTSAIENRAPSNHGDAMSQRDRTAPQATPTRHADAILKIIDVLVRQLSDSPLSTRLALTRLIETLSKILDIPPLPQETLRDFAKRLSAAIEAMPPAARAALEKQLGQRPLVTALRLLLDTLRNEAPPALPRPANLPLKAFEVIDRQKAAPYPVPEAGPARSGPPNRPQATHAAAPAQGAKCATAEPAAIRLPTTTPTTQPAPAAQPPSAAPSLSAPQRAAAIAMAAEARAAEARRTGLSSQGPAASASALPQPEITAPAPSQSGARLPPLAQPALSPPVPSSPLAVPPTAAPVTTATDEAGAERPLEPQPSKAAEREAAPAQESETTAALPRARRSATAKDGIPLLKTAIDYLSRSPDAVNSLLRIVTALRTQEESARPPAALLAAARDWSSDEAGSLEARAAAADSAAPADDAAPTGPARRDPAAARPAQSVATQDRAGPADDAQPARTDLEGTDLEGMLAEMPASELIETEATALLSLGRRPATAPALPPLLDETNMDALISALADEADPDRSDAPALGPRARTGGNGEALSPQDDAQTTARAAAERSVALPPSRPQDLGDLGILRPSENVMQDWIALAFAAASLPPKDVKPRRPDNLPTERSQPLGKDDRDGQKRRGQSPARDQDEPAQNQEDGESSPDGNGEDNAGDAYALYRHMAGFDPEEKAPEA